MMAPPKRKPQTPETDDLYGLPLGEFTAARDALAKRLRGEGERERAQAVAGTRKPTAAAWAVNQLVRREGKRVGELLSLGEKLREAQARVVGGGEAPELSGLADRERRLVGELAEAAARILAERGGRAGEATLEQVRGTLHAAAADAEAAADVAGGRLIAERRAIGLGLGPGASVPRAGRASGRERLPARVASARKRLEAASSAARDARGKAGEAEDRLADARRAADGAQRSLRRAEAAARQARRAAEQAAERERKAAEALERATAGA